ncbi:uncharacterized protein LOC123345992 [Mauremys mutica]|uniref:uncharacterized protein LOC123345992 n=1 Tax=Mauremys mutica TaxID=74926 RepID=UPI001D169252|nr:uncharacterized protein LOC123345992 [Mauremys mutica]
MGALGHSPIHSASAVSCMQLWGVVFINYSHFISTTTPPLSGDTYPTTTPPLSVDTRGELHGARRKIIGGQRGGGGQCTGGKWGIRFPPHPGTILNAGASPHSQGGLPDHDPDANVSTWPLSTPSQRLVQIRRWKKRTRDDMFAKFMQSSRSDSAQLNGWRQTIAESRKALQELEERRDVCNESRQDAMIKLMGEQTDMLCCMVDLMRERQQDHRLPL